MIHACLPFQSGHFSEDMIPTVGFNMRKVTKGNVTIKVFDLEQVISEMKLVHFPVTVLMMRFAMTDVLFILEIWDIGGQPRFRSMWERYCRGVNAIV